MDVLLDFCSKEICVPLVVLIILCNKMGLALLSVGALGLSVSMVSNVWISAVHFNFKKMVIACRGVQLTS